MILFFSLFALGQESLFVPKDPREVLKLRNTFELKDDKIINYSLIENDRSLLIVGKKTTQIWDVESKKIISEIPHEIGKNHLSLLGTKISPDGKYLLVYDRVYSEKIPILVKSKKVGAVIYDLQTGKLVNVLEGQNKWIMDSFWSENGDSFFTLSKTSFGKKESEICFLDGQTLKYRNCFPVFGDVWSSKFSKDGAKFFASIVKPLGNLGENWFGIWDTRQVKLLKSSSVDEQSYGDFFLTSDENYLSVGGTVFEVNSSNLPKFKLDNRIRGVSDNDKFFIASEKKGLQFYDFGNNQRKYLISHVKDDVDIKISTTEKVLINQNLSRHCGRTEGFEIETGKKLWEMKLACRWEASDTFFPSDKPNFNDEIEFLQNGKYFLTTSQKAIRIWDIMTGELLQTLVNPNQTIQNPETDDKLKGEKKAWSKDKKFIYFQDSDDTKIFQYELFGS